MHSLKTNGGTLFHFNSDLSGDVRIVVGDEPPLEVPGQCLLELVAHFLRGEQVNALEQADWQDILGLPAHHWSRSNTV